MTAARRTWPTRTTMKGTAMPRSHKNSPIGRTMRGEYKAVPPDPGACEHVCDHGAVCLGGHARVPSWHWYLCEICTPPPVAAAACRCAHPRTEHTPKCEVAHCGCRAWKPRGGLGG